MTRLPGLSLPPLVVILLLAFVWAVLLVLVLWFLLPGGEQAGEAEGSEEQPRRGRNERLPQPRRGAGDDAEISPPPRARVRSVPAEPAHEERPGTNRETKDAFDDFERSGRRRDDLDF